MEFFMNDEYERTVVSIIDEHNENSTITLDKWTSDVLHEHLPDVHASIQKVYNAICEQNIKKGLNLSRREKGNEVRKYANRKAMEFSPVTLDLSDLEF